MAKTNVDWVALVGNPVEGFLVFGPFASAAAVEDFNEDRDHSDQVAFAFQINDPEGMSPDALSEEIQGITARHYLACILALAPDFRTVTASQALARLRQDGYLQQARNDAIRQIDAAMESIVDVLHAVSACGWTAPKPGFGKKGIKR